MRIILADDHVLFRDALVYYFERVAPDIDVAVARDFHEVMELITESSAVDLVLLDLRMPGMNGLEGLKKLREDYPAIKVALMSGLAERGDVEASLALGAVGYFPKTLSSKAMISGVRQVLDGEPYVPVDHNTGEIMPAYRGSDGDASKALSAVLLRDGAGDQAQSAVIHNFRAKTKLTPRETEVLSYLLKGASNKEIARDLGLQVVTVKLHVRSICRKLEAKNRTQAALIAQQLGFEARAS